MVVAVEMGGAPMAPKKPSAANVGQMPQVLKNVHIRRVSSGLSVGVGLSQNAGCQPSAGVPNGEEQFPQFRDLYKSNYSLSLNQRLPKASQKQMQIS